MEGKHPAQRPTELRPTRQSRVRGGPARRGGGTVSLPWRGGSPAGRRDVAAAGRGRQVAVAGLPAVAGEGSGSGTERVCRNRSPAIVASVLAAGKRNLVSIPR
ncbi:hypothetical protein GCM10020001_081650 [Nonomuraea salmonea]